MLLHALIAIRLLPMPKPSAEERKKGFTKNQVKENARIVAQQRELDPTVLETWYAEIEWVFSSANKRYGPSASRQRRYDECLASER